MFHKQFNIINQRRTRARRGREARNHIPLFAAQQLINRYVQSLARNIIQCNINRALRGKQDAPSLKILTSIYFLPDPSNLHWVFTDQKFPEMFKRANDSLLTSAQTRFAESINSFVSFDLDNKLISTAHPYWQRFDISDAHELILLMLPAEQPLSLGTSKKSGMVRKFSPNLCMWIMLTCQFC